MTPRERTAWNAAVEATRQAALTAAVTIEIRDDAQAVRQQAAVAALSGFADGLRALILEPSRDPGHCFPVDIYNGSEAGTGRGVRP